MMGRMDTESRLCPVCKGSGRDARKRKRPCSSCTGSGKAEYCRSCCEFMPCRGVEEGVWDQTFCARPRKMFEKMTKEVQDLEDQRFVDFVEKELKKKP